MQDFAMLPLNHDLVDPFITPHEDLSDLLH